MCNRILVAVSVLCFTLPVLAVQRSVNYQAIDVQSLLRESHDSYRLYPLSDSQSPQALMLESQRLMLECSARIVGIAYNYQRPLEIQKQRDQVLKDLKKAFEETTPLIKRFAKNNVVRVETPQEALQVQMFTEMVNAASSLVLASRSPVEFSIGTVVPEMRRLCQQTSLDKLEVQTVLNLMAQADKYILEGIPDITQDLIKSRQEVEALLKKEPELQNKTAPGIST